MVLLAGTKKKIKVPIEIGYHPHAALEYDELENIRAKATRMNDELWNTVYLYTQQVIDYVESKTGRVPWHRHEPTHITMFWFPVVREFYLKVIVPELKRLSSLWDVSFFHTHVEYNVTDKEPTAVIFLCWRTRLAGNTVQIILMQRKPLSQWELCPAYYE